MNSLGSEEVDKGNVSAQEIAEIQQKKIDQVGNGRMPNMCGMCGWQYEKGKWSLSSLHKDCPTHGHHSISNLYISSEDMPITMNQAKMLINEFADSLWGNGPLVPHDIAKAIIQAKFDFEPEKEHSGLPAQEEIDKDLKVLAEPDKPKESEWVGELVEQCRIRVFEQAHPTFNISLKPLTDRIEYYQRRVEKLAGWKDQVIKSGDRVKELEKENAKMRGAIIRVLDGHLNGTNILKKAIGLGDV